MINPELQRNLWLEVTPHRLIALPLLILAILYLGFLSNNSELGQEVADTAMLLAWMSTLLWGAMLAGEGLLAEVRGRTWEQQRMSALGAWQLAWGKLLGSTAMAWYGAAVALPVWLLACEHPAAQMVLELARLLLAGLLLQSLSLLAALHGLRRDRDTAGRSWTMPLLLALVLLPWLGFSGAPETPLRWYGGDYTSLRFIVLSLLLFTGWVLIGLWQVMRSELQMQVHPGWWLGFMLTVMFYCAGFVDGQQSALLPMGRLGVAFFAGLILLYGALLVEPKSPFHFIRLLAFWEQSDRRRLYSQLPAWLSAMGLLALTLLLLLLWPVPAPIEGRLFFLALFLFMLRDTLLLLGIAFSPRSKRPELAGVLYLGVLYLLIPLILAALNLSHLAPLLLPTAQSTVWLSLPAAAIEAGLAFLFMRRRWQAVVAAPMAAPQEE